jgi:hypothetical protein
MHTQPFQKKNAKSFRVVSRCGALFHFRRRLAALATRPATG